MKYTLLLLAFTLQLSGQTGAAQPGQDPDDHNYQQARQLMQAVGKIRLREQLTHALLSRCGTTFQHLQPGAEQSWTNWHELHRETLAATLRVQKSVLQNVLERQTVQAADKLLQDIDVIITKGVQDAQQELDSNSKKDQHYICNRLILSISAGNWDLRKQTPAAVKLITEFK